MRGRAGSPRGRVTRSPIDWSRFPSVGRIPASPGGCCGGSSAMGFQCSFSPGGRRDFAWDSFIVPGDISTRGKAFKVRVRVMSLPGGYGQRPWFYDAVSPLGDEEISPGIVSSSRVISLRGGMLLNAGPGNAITRRVWAAPMVFGSRELYPWSPGWRKRQVPKGAPMEIVKGWGRVAATTEPPSGPSPA